MITIPFMVLNDPADPICKPLSNIKTLLRAGRLQRFQKLWGRAPGGDCHAVAGALMADLTDAGQHGWVWCRADCIRLGDHSWVEYDGWAFDASNGCRRGVLVLPSRVYRATWRSRNHRMINIARIAVIIEAARAYALPGREAAVSDVMGQLWRRDDAHRNRGPKAPNP
jgi:hypothetical protein